MDFDRNELEFWTRFKSLRFIFRSKTYQFDKTHSLLCLPSVLGALAFEKGMKCPIFEVTY